MQEAVAEYVKNDSSLFIEGFTHLIGFSAAHEIMRQKIKNLTAIRLTPDLVYDQMIEAGCISKLVFSWAGNPGKGCIQALKRRLKNNKNGEFQIEEYSHFGLVARLMAGSAGLPFWPLKNYQGSNIPDVNPNIRSVVCPFTQERLAAVPALHPDVAIIHCQRADRLGNGQVWGITGTQKETAFAAKKVILVAEEIVDSSIVRADPNRTLIPQIIVDCVVHEPWGAHPSFVQGYYDRDNQFYFKWDALSRDTKKFSAYLDEFVYGVKDRAAYMKKLESGLMDRLKAKPMKCEGVDYGF
jgi:glutaconate CoA-transferase subunit A